MKFEAWHDCPHCHGSGVEHQYVEGTLRGWIDCGCLEPVEDGDDAEDDDDDQNECLTT